MALEVEEVQKKGAVVIFYGVGQTEYSKDKTRDVVSSWFCLPIRVVAAHACIDNPLLYPLMTLVAYSMRIRTLCRFRTYMGNTIHERALRYRNAMLPCVH
jgi:hypothetical protein